MPLKNFYTATSVEPGDIFLVAVKVVVQYDKTYRVYRCPFPEEDIPQGDRMFNAAFFDMIGTEEEDIEPFGDVEITAETLFPILKWTDTPMDMK